MSGFFYSVLFSDILVIGLLATKINRLHFDPLSANLYVFTILKSHDDFLKFNIPKMDTTSLRFLVHGGNKKSHFATYHYCILNLYPFLFFCIILQARCVKTNTEETLMNKASDWKTF